MNIDYLEAGTDYINKFALFIGEDTNLYKYLHNTEKKLTAKRILQEGFNFESHLDHTTDLVSGKDLVELKYFQIKRKRYGNYTIVIEIDKNNVDHFSRKLAKTPYHFSEILTCEEPYIGDNDEPVYKLPIQFIKGFFDHTRQEGIKNNNFNPAFYPEYFNNNLEKLLNS